MTEQPITVVTGCGRCGTSMVMQMLRAGGMRVTGKGPSHEDQRSTALPENSAWLEECRGAAVKILDPHIFTPPPVHPYRFIVMTRDAVQQAESQMKFLRVFGENVTTDRRTRRALSSQNARDVTRIKRIVSFYPNSKNIMLRFEDILRSPLDAAQTLSSFVGKLNADAAASAVISRDPRCFPGMMEFGSTDTGFSTHQ